MTLDSNLVAAAIKDFIFNQWYSTIDWEIKIKNNRDNYIAFLNYTQGGYDMGDYTFSCTFSFNDVQDASDEWVEELANEDDGTVCLSAFLDVNDITIPEIHPTLIDDIDQFNETVSNVCKFIRRAYSTLPYKPDERLYFFYTER